MFDRYSKIKMIFIKLCCCFEQEDKQVDDTSCNSAVVLSSPECIVSQNQELNSLKFEGYNNQDPSRKFEKIDSLVQNLPAQNPSFYDTEGKEVSSNETPSFSDNSKNLIREPYIKPRVRRKSRRKSKKAL
jgi:hypothetical protein